MVKCCMIHSFTGQKSCFGDLDLAKAHFIDNFMEFSSVCSGAADCPWKGHRHVFFFRDRSAFCAFVSREFLNVFFGIRFGVFSRSCELRVSGFQFFKLFEMKKIGELMCFYVIFVNMPKTPKWP